MYPDDLKYTAEHEWVRSPGSGDGTVRVGITQYAQDALGDIVYVQLPDVGEDVESGSAIGELESTKSVSDIYAPVTGTIVKVNTPLGDSPEYLSDDPYDEGWMVQLELTNPAELADLMDAAAYADFLEEQEAE